jgi:5-formyltetrahydrofolate cyclo-ligase
VSAPEDLAAWRATERKRLLALREALDPAQRREQDERIGAALLQILQAQPPRILGIYWPMKGEFDPRLAALRLREGGARIALPVVIRKAEPLEYREWWPGAATTPGVFGLPVPQDTPVVVPDVVLAPPVGFDEHGFRLGYGGGYFDRTLASLQPRPRAIAVAREISRIPTIHPQPWDIPMDCVVTETAVYRDGPGGLRPA